MRLVILASAAVLLAAPAFAEDTSAACIAQALKSVNADGSVDAPCTRGIKQPGIEPGAMSRDGGMAEGKPAVSLPVLFATGSADLTGAGRSQLDKLGAALQDPQLKARHFRIEGHTDTAGGAQTNQTLSERRAGAVADYLATRFGIERGQLAPVGMGKQGLAVATPDQTPEPRNRRVVVINLDG